MTLIMMGLNFLCQKFFCKLKTKNNICTKVFYYENQLTFVISISDQKFENSMDLYLIIGENKSHYLYTKDFDRLCFAKIKNETKKYFRKSCSKCFSNKKVLVKHKEVCLSINGAQYVKLKKEASKLKNALNKYKFHSKCILILSVFKQCRRL